MLAFIYNPAKVLNYTFGNNNTLFHKHIEMVIAAKVVIFADKICFYKIFNILWIKLL